jgi:ribosome recycling factor
MPTQRIVGQHKAGMAKAVEFLQTEFKSVRSGRASTGLIDNISVDYYGTPTPLKQLATIATPEANMIVIKPFDPAAGKEIEKAVRNSDLGINPVNDGKIIRLNIPPLSQERRKQIASQVKQIGEHAKISIRNIRRDANKQLDDEQKSKLITEDDRDKGKKQIDDLTKDFADKVDKIVKAKADEIMLD